MILEIKNLEASYGSLKVLKGINISAKKGDLVALVGPNGSGKSTILKCVCGLLKPENGKILFNNNSVVEKRPDEIVCLGISYVPQGRLVFETLTVEENLEIGGFILKDKELVQKRIKEVYEHFPMLQNIRKQKATFLSGGQQQMLSIGRSLMLKPTLMLLDEPSAGLDPQNMTLIFKKIQELNKTGMTIILVEQNAHMALEICNKSYVLRAGKVAIHKGSRTEKKEAMKDLYLGA